MEFDGVVFKKMAEVTGTSARGSWKKQDVVFEIPGEFSRKICVTFFGDRADDAAALQEGDGVQVSVNVESREYNGKWYTDVKAWKIVRKEGGASGAGYGGSGGGSASGGGRGGYGNRDASAAGGSSFSDAPFNESSAPSPADEVDDLPF
ncbi:MAG: DUF3127 domain-containing protein [Alistipes sp.]|jgi:single-stranded DNA-binding protein|nr:DUF3127 domain-containing protein [Alistipes sp.]